MVAEPPKVTRYTRVLHHICYLLRRSDCFRPSDRLAGWDSHPLEIADFHAVPFFNCGSLHDGRGLKFKLRDMPAATECIRAIEAPCIAYKILGAGRIDPQMAFEYAFDHIKPTDVVNVGMHRGDRDGMVEENVAMVEDLV